ncbi:MAG: tRNA guanosine(34) transglycosylase Tgt [Candidatus Melainabacteria bacterium]|nr:tRNA guanosine(34) transglycosylase Tgt [Candidatus Melainabacteria bacterium]
MQKPFSFEIEATSPWSGARAGRLVTPHGVVETPVFMPVGTNATIKALCWDQVASCGTQMVLANSYHLYLRPGHKLIGEAGGLHQFASWHKPILTDSGGFQIFSLDSLRQITDSGVYFKDHRSGSEHFIGPGQSMEIQNALGSDIIMAFDECVKNPASYEQARAAMDRTHRWLDKCVTEHKRPLDQALFGIVQGSTYEDLRSQSASVVTSFNLPGYAIGGVAVGENRTAIERIVLSTAQMLPKDKPRYLMGVGTPWDIAYAIRCGIDMFDCVLPTRLARHGAAFIGSGRVSLRNSRFVRDFQPLEPGCNCFTCCHHSRAYLNHLVRIKEMAAGSLLSIHNIYHLHQQSHMCRKAILAGRFKDYFESQISLPSPLP